MRQRKILSWKIKKQRNKTITARPPKTTYHTYVLCAEETNEIQVASEVHGLRPMKASVQEQAAVDGTRVGAEKLDQNIQVPGAQLARPVEDSQFPERDQLVIRGGQEPQRDQLVRGGQEPQRAAEEGGWGGWLWVPRSRPHIVMSYQVALSTPLHLLFIVKRRTGRAVF